MPPQCPEPNEYRTRLARPLREKSLRKGKDLSKSRTNVFCRQSREHGTGASTVSKFLVSTLLIAVGSTCAPCSHNYWQRRKHRINTLFSIRFSNIFFNLGLLAHTYKPWEANRFKYADHPNPHLFASALTLPPI
jgi:hypothetical protein